MTKREFLDLLDRHGADPSRWPAPLRLQADRAMAADGDLRSLLLTEQALEAALSDLPQGTATPDLRRAILDIPLDHPLGLSPPSLARMLLAGWRRWTAGMATVTAAGLIGFVLGYGQLVTLPPASAGEQAASDDLVTLLGDSSFLESVELENAE